MRFLIEFPFPAAEQRRALWQALLPPAATLSASDFDRLQLLELTGGDIRNVVLHTAMVAAERATAISVPVILEAAGLEPEAKGHEA